MRLPVSHRSLVLIFLFCSVFCSGLLFLLRFLFLFFRARATCALSILFLYYSGVYVFSLFFVAFCFTLFLFCLVCSLSGWLFFVLLSLFLLRSYSMKYQYWLSLILC